MKKSPGRICGRSMKSVQLNKDYVKGSGVCQLVFEVITDM